MAESLFKSFAQIDHLNSEKVHELIESNKPPHHALLECIEHGKMTLYAERLKNRIVIPSNGDIVVGFFASDDVTFDLMCSSRIVVQRTSLKKHQFTYALSDSLPLLIICTRFHETSVSVVTGDIGNIYVVYGLLNTEDRGFLARNKFYAECEKKYIAYCSGMYHFFDFKPEGYIEIPRWNRELTVEEMKQRARVRTQILLKDLVESAWRPDRFMHWCIPFDEVIEGCEFGQRKKYATKLYLNDVILIEDAAFDIQDIDPFLRSQGLRRVGHFNRIVYEKEGGLELHKDNPLQGGDVSVVFYFNDADGGHIVFPGSNVRVMPKKGRCLIFDVNVLHYVEPIASGTKEVLTCECIYV